MAKQKTETENTGTEKTESYRLSSAVTQSGYRALIDGVNVVIAPGQTEVSGLSEEAVRQLVIAQGIILTDEQSETFKAKHFKK